MRLHLDESAVKTQMENIKNTVTKEDTVKQKEVKGEKKALKFKAFASKIKLGVQLGAAAKAAR